MTNLCHSLEALDPQAKLTPIQIRDVMVECFFDAHQDYTGMDIANDEKIVRDYCRSIVVKAFEDGGGDFNQPNKSTLAKALHNLVDFSKNFRDEKYIEDNLNMLMTYINKLDVETEK